MTAPSLIQGLLARLDADTLVSEGRDWLADCAWRGLDDADTVAEAVSDLTDAGVLAMVDTHYEGGLYAFVWAVTP